MAGGLLQIASYGSQDIYLTGTPQITFFKAVYRRYTNFSIETVRQSFDDTIDFGRDAMCTLKKNGDLIHKTTLVAEIPEVRLEKDNFVPPTDTCMDLYYTDRQTDFNTCETFMTVNTGSYRAAMAIYNPYPASEATALTEGQAMVAAIKTYFTTNDPYSEYRDNYQNLIVKYVGYYITDYTQFEFPRSYNTSCMYAAVSEIKDSEQTTDRVTQVINTCLSNSIDIHGFFYYRLVNCNLESDEKKSTYAAFAWNTRLGHAMIDRIDFLIGGHKIDRHTGDWFNISYDLMTDVFQSRAYNILIGNVPELTVYDRLQKPSYQIMLPLRFYFCQHNGSALPIISLQAQDVQLSVKFKTLKQCCYVEDTTTLENKIHLTDAYFLVDYVYLGTDERRRFAQSTHEYLIEQLQINTFNIYQNADFRAKLDFFHPCKELIFVFQFNDYIENPDGYKPCQWDNFSLTDSKMAHADLGKGNPISFAQFFLNRYDRTPKLAGNYYEYVETFEVHKRSPIKDGINIISFALHPETLQPSSTCNLSKIDLATLEITFDPLVTASTNGGILKVFATNYNILRFYGGMAGEAFYP